LKSINNFAKANEQKGTATQKNEQKKVPKIKQEKAGTAQKRPTRKSREKKTITFL
jgi:hypothetical protein